MAKVVKAAYQSFEETATGIENLLREGYSSIDLTVVTIKDNKEAVESLINTDIDLIPTEESKNVWDKVKDAFTEENAEENPLEKYGLDQETAGKYNDVIRNGGYVVLSEETKTPEVPVNFNDQGALEEQSDPQTFTGDPVGFQGVRGDEMDPLTLENESDLTTPEPAEEPEGSSKEKTSESKKSSLEPTDPEMDPDGEAMPPKIGDTPFINPEVPGMPHDPSERRL